MIDVKTKIHDRFCVEFKIGLKAERNMKKNDFKLGIWMFIPRSLDINSATYSKNEFYRDLKSYLRLITPVFPLKEIAGGRAIPLHLLEDACNNLVLSQCEENEQAYEYHLKMFAVIVKSAFREDEHYIIKAGEGDDVEYLCDSYLEAARQIFDKFHELRRILGVPSVTDRQRDAYKFADEFLCNIFQERSCLILEWLSGARDCYSDKIKAVGDFTREIGAYCTKMHYPCLDGVKNGLNNSLFVENQGALKRYVEHPLYLTVPKRKDGVMVEQIVASLAAGLAMIFATAVSFGVQRKYGNFTMPLFVALVISYMLKDRIKELTRHLFVNNLSVKYYDNKGKIFNYGKEIGMLKEGVDYISKDRIPADILKLREKHYANLPASGNDDDTVILYRKHLDIDGDKLAKVNDYHFSGINDIVRFQFGTLIRKMADPSEDLHILLDDNSVKHINCDKYYFINIILQCEFSGKTTYKHYRLQINRDGIRKIHRL